ncbi:MAG: VCBS repeat-containing protein, partial [Bacteroidia bacterium]|nr:VCBS repeat-containing protein [Bacteroidia bacterium]
MKFFIHLSTVIVFVFFAFYFFSCKGKESELNKKNNELYLKGLQPGKDVNNVFSPEGQVASCDSILALPGYPESKKQIVVFVKAVNLLYLGRENEAIQFLEGIIGKNTINDQPKLMNDVRKYLALAYQRLGERNNCVSNHTSSSCIFPIQGKGIYSDTMASSNSIKIYEEILKQNPNDLESKWLLNIVFMTLGQYPKKVPSALLIPDLDKDPSSYHVKPFENIASGLNLNDFRNMAGGSIVDDFNNDNYLDIITSAWGLDEGMHYFRNNKDGSFTDVSKESGLSNIKGGLNIIQADYNNDGYTDILVLRGAWWREFGKQPNTLLKNNGDGTFADVTVESGILSFHPTQTATWADFNNDGWLDLFIGNETVSKEYPHPSELFINNQNGTFTEEAAASGCQIIGFTKGVTSGDYNNDGWTDIFISDLTGKKRLLKNKGLNSKIPQFTDITHEAGFDKDPSSTFPTWFWDYNNDGWPDIFICGYQYNGSLGVISAAEALKLPAENPSRMYLYRNNHDGTFSDVSVSAGLNKAVFAMGSNFGDIDNDGWLDMYLGTGNPDLKSLVPNRLFKNIGGQKFADVTYSSRTGNLQKG